MMYTPAPIQPYLEGFALNAQCPFYSAALYYDLDTGDVFRFGKLIKLSTDGYIQTTLRNKSAQIAVHFIDWLRGQGADIPAHLVADHIDNNPSNNHPANLRAITQKQNLERRVTNVNNQSGVKRYFYDSRYKRKYSIRDQRNGKSVFKRFYSKRRAKIYSKALDDSIEQEISETAIYLLPLYDSLVQKH